MVNMSAAMERPAFDPSTLVLFGSDAPVCCRRNPETSASAKWWLKCESAKKRQLRRGMACEIKRPLQSPVASGVAFEETALALFGRSAESPETASEIEARVSEVV
eukprot:3083374-Rhodomonas_salina.5